MTVLGGGIRPPKRERRSAYMLITRSLEPEFEETTDYVNLLKSRDVEISMANTGEPKENGYAERLMRTIKEEEVDLSEYEELADAWRQLARFLDDVYNTKRIHSSLGHLTPREFEQQWMDNRCVR